MHPDYGLAVNVGTVPAPELNLSCADAIHYLMQEWQETVKEKNIRFTDYAIFFGIEDLPFRGHRVSYRAVHRDKLVEMNDRT